MVALPGDLRSPFPRARRANFATTELFLASVFVEIIEFEGEQRMLINTFPRIDESSNSHQVLYYNYDWVFKVLRKRSRGLGNMMHHHLCLYGLSAR